MKIIKKYLIERPIGMIRVPKDAVCLSASMDEFDRDEHGERVIVVWVMYDWTDPMPPKGSDEAWETRFIQCATADSLFAPGQETWLRTGPNRGFIGSVRYEYANGQIGTYHLFESVGKPPKKEG